jgi:hypothetical protein
MKYFPKNNKNPGEGIGGQGKGGKGKGGNNTPG